MEIELETLNLQELNTLLKSARKQKLLLAKRVPIATARRKVVAVASKAGYTLDELFGLGASPAGAAKKSAKGKKRGKVAPKYRDPENRQNTWSGRGTMPLWMSSKIKFGRSVADFLIPGLGKPTASGTENIGQKRVIKQDEA